MYTKLEAELFVRNLFEEVITNRKAELLDQYYNYDAIEHHESDKYNFNEIKNQLINREAKYCRYGLVVEKIDVYNNFIFCLCSKYLLENSDDNSSNEFEFWVCQLRNKRICESWCMVDKVDMAVNERTRLFSAHKNTACGFSALMLQ